MYEMDQQEEYCYLFLSSIGDVVESGESVHGHDADG